MQVVFIKPDALLGRQFAFQNGIVMSRTTVGFTEEFDMLFTIG
jgi:hypothetical protein